MSGLTTYEWIVDESGNDRYNVIGYNYELVETSSGNKITALAGFSEDDDYTAFDQNEATKKYDLVISAKTFTGLPGNRSTNWALESFDTSIGFNSGLFKNWLDDDYQFDVVNSSTSKGTVNIDNDTGKWQYQANQNENGIDSFDYMAAEGVKVIDRVVEKELKGKINLVKNTWVIPFK